MNNYYVPQPIMWGNSNATTPIIPQQFLPAQIPIQNKESDGNSFVWIQGGKTVAQAYPVAPGQTIGLIDEDNSTIFVKSADDSGKPNPLRIFKETEEKEIIEEKPNLNEFIKKEDLSDYVTKEDIDDVFKELQGIQDTLLEMQTAPTEQSDNNNNRRWK